MKKALITGVTGQDCIRLAYEDFLHNPMRAER